MNISDDAPKMRVKCSVENCEYNKEHMCHANSLEVNSMGFSNKAESSDGTCCTTFECDKW